MNLFRHGLKDQAAKLCEDMEDETETLLGRKGIKTIISFFARAYEGYHKVGAIQTRKDVLNAPRESRETFMAYCARKKVEFRKFGKAHGTPRASTLHGKLMLDMTQLTKLRKAMVFVWAEGSFEMDDLMQHFHELDLPWYWDLGSGTTFMRDELRRRSIG